MPTLSPRELEIARLVAEDLADKTIANILQVSIHTVHAHLTRIGKKLGAGERPIARRRVIARWVQSYEAPPDPTQSQSAA